jgi:molybdenum cofactor cytidylyltransferase
MSISGSFAAIILAAGSSSRMGAGRHKLLLPLGNKPVLAHVVTATLASWARPIVLVLGHQVEQVRTQIAIFADFPEVISIENPHYLQGMSTSLRAGLQTLIQSENTHGQAFHSLDGVIILLGDQPLLTSQSIDALITCKQTTGKRIVAPLYNGKRGNPVLFDASLFPELLEISGDEGARSVIERHKQEIATIELSDAVANYDVDTWEAYQVVVAQWERKQHQGENKHDD